MSAYLMLQSRRNIQRSITLLWILISLLLSSHGMAQNAGPSLRETYDWLGPNLINPDCITGDNKWQKQHVTDFRWNNKGDIIVETWWQNLNDDDVRNYHTYYFNIRDIVNVRNNCMGGCVVFSCDTGEFCIKEVRPDKPTRKKDTFMFHICSKTERIVKAFEHYRNLVGGLRRSNEPF